MNARPPIRVFLAEDSEIVRHGIKAVLASHGQSLIKIVGEAGTAAAALVESSRLRPDVVLLDIRLPDGTGLEVCRKIAQDQPGARIIVLTAFSSDDLVQDAIAAGAQGFLTKEIDPDRLVQAILDVADGKSILDADATARLMRMMRSQTHTATSEGLAALSPQERRVLALVAEGQTNKEIGESLDLSDNTVKNYLGSIFEKLKVKKRSQAAAIFVQTRLARE